MRHRRGDRDRWFLDVRFPPKAGTRRTVAETLGTASRQECYHRVHDDHIMAVGLLTARDLEALGPTFRFVWPVEHAPSFSELLHAIDQADLEILGSDDPELPPED